MMTPEYKRKRFGIFAIEMGFIIKDQLIEALRAQIDLGLHNRDHKFIGEILVDMGYMEPEQVDEILLKMELIY